MDFDGEKVHNLDTCELVARIDNLWDLCRDRLHGQEGCFDEYDTEMLGALIEELSGRQL